MHKVMFDEENHIYRVDGVVKPSVTQVLKDAGMMSGYDDIPEYYRDRGDRVHEACALYAQGWLDWDSVTGDIEPYIRTFRDIYDSLGVEYLSAEEPCYDPELGVCGKYDLLVSAEGEKVLIEIKTGSFPMWGGIQIAAYKRMTGAEFGLGLELKTGKVYEANEGFYKNELTWKAICDGSFNLEAWSRNRNRRYMRVMK